MSEELKQARRELGLAQKEVGELRTRAKVLELQIADATTDRFNAMDIARHARKRMFRLELAYSILWKTLEFSGPCLFKVTANSALTQAGAIYSPPKHLQPPTERGTDA